MVKDLGAAESETGEVVGRSGQLPMMEVVRADVERDPARRVVF